MRYERKFVLKNQKEYIGFIKLMKLTEFDFNEIHNERIINNLYFDNDNSDSLFQNFNGEFNKLKIRLRWYNNENIYRLELKEKSGGFGSKKKIKVLINSGIEIINYPNKVQNSTLRLEDIIMITNETYLLRKLRLVSYNSYKRKYLFNKKLNIRITIDSSLFFKNLRIGNISFHKPYKIIELKYEANKNFEDKYAFLVKNFNSDLTKFSKFSNSSYNFKYY